MGSFKNHGVMLYLAPELYLGFVKMQADKNLGRSYAALLAYTEGLYKLGYINQDVYERYAKKYDVPLVQEENKALTKEQVTEQEENEEWLKRFSDVAHDWENVPEKSKQYYVKKAEELIDKVPEAKLILELHNKER